MDLELRDQVFMVAAASKGLGFGIAQALAKEGAKVSIASRTREDIEKASEQLCKETGAEVVGMVFDAKDPSTISNWTKATIERFGGVDGLVVNAGGPPTGGFDNFDDEAWQAAFELTLLSSVRMIRSVLPSMRERGGGSIITVTSSSVKEPRDILLLSNVMRSGVTSLEKSLSHSLAGENIRVNNLVPGRMDTDRVHSLDSTLSQRNGVSLEEQRKKMEGEIPLQRYGTIEEFGKMGAFLLSKASSYITGQTIVVDGGTMKTVW